jgi:hypothetical protein
LPLPREKLYRVPMTLDASQSLSPLARRLTLLGIAPQGLAFITALSGEEWRWIGLATAYAYAAFIFSFLGGMWWGLAFSNAHAPSKTQTPSERHTPGWIFVVAVCPSLIALATYLPWVIGWAWPGPSLLILGLGLIASPVVDRAIAQHIALPQGWMKTRWEASLALGGMTMVLAALA